MHPSYSTIFDIENLKLNSHYQTASTAAQTVTDEHSSNTKPLLELNSMLYQDLQRAFAPIEIKSVLQAEQVNWQDGLLFLPKQALSVHDKRTLWSLMSDYLDNL